MICFNSPEEIGAERQENEITIPQEGKWQRERSECQTHTDSPQELFKTFAHQCSCDQWVSQHSDWWKRM